MADLLVHKGLGTGAPHRAALQTILAAMVFCTLRTQGVSQSHLVLISDTRASVSYGGRAHGVHTAHGTARGRWAVKACLGFGTRPRSSLRAVADCAGQGWLLVLRGSREMEIKAPQSHAPASFSEHSSASDSAGSTTSCALCMTRRASSTAVAKYLEMSARNSPLQLFRLSSARNPTGGAVHERVQPFAVGLVGTNPFVPDVVVHGGHRSCA